LPIYSEYANTIIRWGKEEVEEAVINKNKRYMQGSFLLNELEYKAYNSINIMKKRINKPNVKRQIKGIKFIRSGRGFSKSELSEAGISNMSTAKNNGIPIDMLRKTKNPENVEQLKSIAKDLLNLKK
jgi:ribosomal protein L13E